jgi:pimeloyl-ACP methyl ester carboxylesterase
MITPTPDVVSTSLGRLHIGQAGSGPPAVLWHSIFVDSRSWGPLVEEWAAHRRVVTIDGPGHGRSSPIHHDFTLDDCAIAAAEALDGLNITEPVDWVGNAWGGHVGITLAARQPHRVRSLVTIGAPVTPVGRRQRWTMVVPLAVLYRLVGANRFVTKAVSDALLGADAFAAQPDRAAEIMSAFQGADRASMQRTIRFMLSWRDLSDRLPSIATPTLMIAARDDAAQHWQPADARAAAATMPCARAEAASGAGHVAPLFDVDLIAKTVTEFWESLR